MVPDSSLPTVSSVAGSGRFRTLIIGAGVAGMTLADLLYQRGERPVLIERADNFRAAGYNLGLYPLGSRVLHGLGLYPKFLGVSTGFNHYHLGNGKGEIVHRLDLGDIAEKYGPMRGIRRAELLELLQSGVPDLPIRFGTTATSFAAHEDRVDVRFSDGSNASFDLVIGADGMHSDTRKTILRPDEWSYWETGWACYASWADANIVPPETSEEYWGAGRGVGVYPVRDATGVILAGPKKLLKEEGAATSAERMAKVFGALGGPVPKILKAVGSTPHPFFWDLEDCRATRWSSGRILLLGDAATGFLPTAGIGASMAMLSAAALADELSRADPSHVEYAYRIYTHRVRKAVEAAQETSRRLAKMLFVDSAPLAWGRDQLMRFYTPDRALADIEKLMEQ